MGVKVFNLNKFLNCLLLVPMLGWLVPTFAMNGEPFGFIDPIQIELLVALDRVNLEKIELAFEHNADPNKVLSNYRIVSYHGLNPLGIAIQKANDIWISEPENLNCLKAIKLLVAKGADVNAKDLCGIKALHYAISPCKLSRKLVKFLFKHGAIIDEEAIKRAEKLEVSRFILFLNCLQEKILGKNMLKKAIKQRCIFGVRSLLKSGVQPDEECLKIAKRKGNKKIGRMLISHFRLVGPAGAQSPELGLISRYGIAGADSILPLELASIIATFTHD